MASYESYRTDDGRKRVLAVVRIKGFNRVSQAFDSLRDAREWAEATEREMREKRDRGGARRDLATLTVEDLVKGFLDAPKTKQRRYLPELTQILGCWVDQYKAIRLRSFGRLQIGAYRDQLIGSGLSPARTNRYLSAMRRAWNWGVEEGYCTAPWPQKVMLEEPKPEAILERYGTADATLADVEAVFAACDAEHETLGSLVRFLVGTGARLSDALGVRWRDVDTKAADVAIRGQKADRPQRVAMLAPAVAAIERATKVRHVSGRVFWQLADRHDAGYRFEKARAKFPEHLRRMRLHDCRHLCASFLAAHGATDVELAAQLGHSTLAMVKRYAHLRGGHRGAAHAAADAAFAGKKP